MDKQQSDALAEFERRIQSYPLASINSTDLLLLDIARSLREQTMIAKEGLAFSQGLAHLFETEN
jgi:hypothetical protein